MADNNIRESWSASYQLGATLDGYITSGEFALLLGIFWLPVFIFASIAQWQFLAAHRGRIIWIVIGLLLETVLAFAIWLSPLHRYLFPSLDFLDGFSSGLSIGSIPLQAAALAAVAVTFLIWVVGSQVLLPKHRTISVIGTSPTAIADFEALAVTRLRPEEFELGLTADGDWDSAAQARIHRLVSDHLQQLSTTDDGWSALFRDPQDGRYWELTYPHSAMHGGGPARLTMISRETAQQRYGEIVTAADRT